MGRLLEWLNGEADRPAVAAAAGLPPPLATMRLAAPRTPADNWVWTAVDRLDAMAVPTLAFIRNQLAGGIASMQLERWRTNPDGTTVQIDAGWCADPDPAPTQPVSIFWQWVVDDLFFGGSSTLIVLARNAEGFPVQFRRVLPGQLTYEPTTSAYGQQITQQISYRGVVIPPGDVVVIPGPHEGLVNYGARTIRAALDLEAAAGQSATEPLPSVELHQTSGEPISPTAAGDLVDSWKDARARGSTAYTPASIEARVLGFSAADLQMVEARQYMATQLARLAGVNPVLVSAAMGSASSYVYTNQGDYRQAFLDDVLDTYLRAVEGRLSANDVTPRGQLVRFDRDAFTRVTTLERTQILIGAMKSGADPAMLDRLARLLDIDAPAVAPSPSPPPPPVPQEAPVP